MTKRFLIECEECGRVFDTTHKDKKFCRSCEEQRRWKILKNYKRGRKIRDLKK